MSIALNVRSLQPFAILLLSTSIVWGDVTFTGKASPGNPGTSVLRAPATHAMIVRVDVTNPSSIDNNGNPVYYATDVRPRAAGDNLFSSEYTYTPMRNFSKTANGSNGILLSDGYTLEDMANIYSSGRDKVVVGGKISDLADMVARKASNTSASGFPVSGSLPLVEGLAPSLLGITRYELWVANREEPGRTQFLPGSPGRAGANQAGRIWWFFDKYITVDASGTVAGSLYAMSKDFRNPDRALHGTNYKVIGEQAHALRNIFVGTEQRDVFLVSPPELIELGNLPLVDPNNWKFEKYPWPREPTQKQATGIGPLQCGIMTEYTKHSDYFDSMTPTGADPKPHRITLDVIAGPAPPHPLSVSSEGARIPSDVYEMRMNQNAVTAPESLFSKIGGGMVKINRGAAPGLAPGIGGVIAPIGGAEIARTSMATLPLGNIHFDFTDTAGAPMQPPGGTYPGDAIPDINCKMVMEDIYPDSIVALSIQQRIHGDPTWRGIRWNDTKLGDDLAVTSHTMDMTNWNFSLNDIAAQGSDYRVRVFVWIPYSESDITEAMNSPLPTPFGSTSGPKIVSNSEVNGASAIDGIGRYPTAPYGGGTWLEFTVPALSFSIDDSDINVGPSNPPPPGKSGDGPSSNPASTIITDE